MTVFDADTQETSYGIWHLDGLPHIFDTHRAKGRYIATLELLTELAHPLRIRPDVLRGFGLRARRQGLLPLPYSTCFFRGNLHVYVFSGSVRGFDLATVGSSSAESEERLRRKVDVLRPTAPKAVLQAQRDLLEGRRPVRHREDLEVLLRRWVRDGNTERKGTKGAERPGTARL